jgi:pimeloyl-ACP methyl ester carboxylesterase
MTTFALIHGAWHDSWCWARVARKLEQRGYGTVVVDLPCDDIRAGWNAYASVAIDALADSEDDVIAVGHSLGGGVVPLVAAVRPVTQMVFLCSFPPSPGESLDAGVAREPSLSDPRALAWRECLDTEGRYVWPDFESAVYAMYHDCAPEDAQAAFVRLRPQARAPFVEPWPLRQWPPGTVRFIVCSDDRLGTPESLRAVAKTRFGIASIELPGSHSPFLSRPEALAATLAEFAG